MSSVIPDLRGITRTRPLEALVVGAYVRGLSDRDIKDLAHEVGLGQLSAATRLPLRVRAVINRTKPKTRGRQFRG